MYKNIIFDLGNVLLEFNPEKYLDQYFTDSNLIQELYQVIFKSPEWIELDRGTMSKDEFTDVICKRKPELKNEIKLVLNNWEEMLDVKEASVKVLKNLNKKGYDLFALSNFHETAFQVVYDKYDFFSVFRGMVISAREKCVKPEEEIYRILLENYGLAPGESLFIDDTRANLDTAERMGINTILFVNAVQLEEELHNKGIL